MKQLTEQQRADKKHEEAKKQMLMQAAILASDVDTFSVLKTNDAGGIDFDIPGSKFGGEVIIEMHRVMPEGSWHSYERGLKYKVSTPGDWNQRFYVNPKTVMKKVNEIIAKATRKAEATDAHTRLWKMAMEKAVDQWPTAKITSEEERKAYTHTPGKPATIRVSRDSGWVEFTYSEAGMDVQLNFRNRGVSSKALGEKINDMLIGAPRLRSNIS